MNPAAANSMWTSMFAPATLGLGGFGGFGRNYRRLRTVPTPVTAMNPYAVNPYMAASQAYPSIMHPMASMAAMYGMAAGYPSYSSLYGYRAPLLSLFG